MKMKTSIQKGKTMATRTFDQKKAMNAVNAARSNGGSLFRRVKGCAEAVKLGWMKIETSRSRLSIGQRANVSRYERLYGWVDREWKLTERAPVGLIQKGERR